MLPECRALPDFHRTLINDGQIQEYWFSVLWEHPFGNSCLDFFKALTMHYGLTTAEASYFSKHHEADTMDHLDRKSHGAVTQRFSSGCCKRASMSGPAIRRNIARSRRRI